MKKVVTIGGGTGNFVVLSGLKSYDVDLSAIVSMADDGGSTGVLRDELGVLPPGDVRQCLIALSDSSRLMRSLMNYRFDTGRLCGHSFGNIFLSALEKTTGSFEKAVEEVGKVLSIKGKVIPVTTHQVKLKMLLKNGKLLEGEKDIHSSTEICKGFDNLYLEPFPKANQRAIDEIMNADLIVFSPGGIYTSLIPNLLVEGIPKALRETKAKKLLVVNLVNKHGQTPLFKAGDYLREIQKYIGKDIFDFIIVNSGKAPKELVDKYAAEGSVVENDLIKDARVTFTDVLSNELKEVQKGDLLVRNLIRHDPQKLAKVIMEKVNEL